MAFVKEDVPGVIHLCPDFFNLSINLPVERAATLLHEVRHLDAEAHHHPHVTCTQGRLKSEKAACDESMEAAGGYAVEAEALVRMAALPPDQISPLEKAQAKNAALILANEKFNRSIFAYDLRGIFVVDQSNNNFILELSIYHISKLIRQEQRAAVAEN